MIKLNDEEAKYDRLIVGMIKEWGKYLTIEELEEFAEWAKENPKDLHDYDIHPMRALFLYIDYLNGTKIAKESYDTQSFLPFKELLRAQG